MKIKIKSYFKLADNKVGKFPFLDGLRAVAIILVLGRHIIHYWPNEIRVQQELSLFYNGWLGVDLFFVLSGFLIFYHLLLNWPDSNVWNYIKRFFAKRSLRILPLYFAIILLIGVNAIPLYSPAVNITQQLIAYHLLFIQEYFYSPILVSLWSLATEEKFYVIAPFLVFLFSKFNKVNLLFFLSLLFIFISVNSYLKLNQTSIESYSEYFWHYRAPFLTAIKGLLVGAIVAVCYMNWGGHSQNNKRVKYVFYSIIPLWFSLLIFKPYIESKNWVTVDLIVTIFSLLNGIFIYCGLHLKNKITFILGSKFLRRIAILSYSLYITHVTVIPLSIMITDSLQLQGFIYSFSLIFIFLFNSLVFSLILYFLVEKPFLLIKSKI